MAIAVSELTSFSSTNNASAYTCMANITPPTNQLVLLWVSGSRSGGASVAPTATGCGLTWNASNTSIVFNGGLRRLSLYTASGSASAGTVHIAFAATQSHVFATLAQCTGETQKLIQSASTSGTALSVLSCALSAFSGANNAVAVGWSRTSATQAINPRDSASLDAFTPKLGEAQGTGTGSDSGTIASAWSQGIALVTTLGFSSGATWTTAGDCAGIACEINIAAAAGAATSPYYSLYYVPLVAA